MAAQVTGVLPSNLQKKISESKILVVGAGGIGCEILKNLVLSGFQDIEIIDLDTIDVSNLNRQFLFHKEHVGKSKAEVAKESALKFNPNVNIKSYHDSITTANYGINFFKNFDLVLNALDNLQARNHVNRMCLNADVPLIESGTAGYNGQVELIKKGLTQCYECTPKPTQKTYPGCTIRNTPSEPIHCIVWAKHLFNQLFGEANEDEEVSPDTADPEAGGDAGQEALNTKSNEKGNVNRINTRQWAHDIDYDAEKIFNKLFYDDIKYLLSMSNLWKTRMRPIPIKYNDIVSFDSGTAKVDGASVLPDQKVWTITECAKIFASSINNLKTEIKKLKENDHLIWDKDEKDAMDFVAACANIRSQIFNIPQKSRFDIKSMAGNIIPAIATTNAITAGLVVMQAFKVLTNNLEKCKPVFVRIRPNPRNLILVPENEINPPNPKCYVCSSKPTVYLRVDTKKMTVRELRDDVLKKALNMIEPDATLDAKGVIVISSEEDETECNNDKKLIELQICDGALLKVDDFLQNYELSVIITHADAERDKPLFEVIADPDTLKPKQEEKNGENSEAKSDNTESCKEKTEEKEIVGATENKKARIDDGVIFENNGNSGSNNKESGINDAGSEDDCMIVQHSSTGDNLKRKMAPVDDAGEGSSSSIVKRAKIVSNDMEDDDLVIVEDD
ncbi:SUMO-activating enzyme subunit 2 [Condylostylus longicornis]|uniref:SUMO-activating enzyme subunit 2 n=1 Tax=Condylostylus longicornis TaxID=2530218 RepID=UPI00244E537D|nr:SUMO-activating enzyme subunit 2 [Condylostylus longicornis]XP_055379749.1 SUMO-activating enzyme subunit 2 [Condylostylus longicornis]XP_055379751.1 SUMO-activating enzyme subunit 2 [Condylostylus longicornis]XP_055379752.1 SUMO-activating enzyme subunit 2 [Condylostylus longicornis]